MVKIDKSVDVPFENGGMVHGGSSAIAVYNTDQKSIISRFKEADDFEKDALYLFFVDNVQGKTGDVAGFMPLQRQAGFIYDSPNLFVVAHELAHGAFNLRHTFSPENFIAAERTTKNLMDYTGDTELWQSQWNLIHDPENMLFAWAQDEAEGEMITNGITIDSMFLYLGTNRIQPNSYQLITAAPEMPDIRIKPFKNGYTGSEEIEVRLKIEDRRRNSNNVQVRNDSTFYPSNGWQKVKVNEMWNIDFGAEMRGGKAYVYYKSGSTTKSETFYIRGANPTEQDVRTYLTSQNYNEWFLMKLMREESTSLVVGQPMRHFITGTNYSQVWSYNSVGCPTLGSPRGFGLMQLDNFGTANGTLLVATPNQVWNWKTNIDRGVQFLREDKLPWAEDRISGYATTIDLWNTKNSDNTVNDSMKIEQGLNSGTIVYTIQEGNTTNNETFAINPTGTQRGIQFALALKYYNSGGNRPYCTLRQVGNNKPYWAIDRLNSYTPPFNYVERVCSRNP